MFRRQQKIYADYKFNNLERNMELLKMFLIKNMFLIVSIVMLQKIITPIQKQDLEGIFWDLFNGGKIQYVRYSLNYNIEAMKTLIVRAMRKGFYEGVNLSLAYCEECGHEELDMDVCPCCGSRNLTKIDRMNGYLAFSRVKGDTRLNKAKMIEISQRKFLCNILEGSSF